MYAEGSYSSLQDDQTILISTQAAVHNRVKFDIEEDEEMDYKNYRMRDEYENVFKYYRMSKMLGAGKQIRILTI
jgi:hypothetical protein